VLIHKKLILRLRGSGLADSSSTGDIRLRLVDFLWLHHQHHHQAVHDSPATCSHATGPVTASLEPGRAQYVGSAPFCAILRDPAIDYSINLRAYPATPAIPPRLFHLLVSSYVEDRAIRTLACTLPATGHLPTRRTMSDGLAGRAEGQRLVMKPIHATVGF
jgi:hypothetical protein